MYKSMSQPLMLMKLKLTGSMKTTRPSRINTIKDVLFIIGDWNAKVGSQEISGATGKFSLGVQKCSRAVYRFLPSELSGHSKHPLSTTHETILHMNITVGHCHVQNQ